MRVVYNPHRIASLANETSRRLSNLEVRMKREIAFLRQNGVPFEEALVRMQPAMVQALDVEYGSVGVDLEEAQVRQKIVERLDGQRQALRHFGSNIYDVGRLALLFSKTVVDDVSLGEVELPYTVLYIHFGEDAELDVSGSVGVAGTHIEGAYVCQHTDPEADDEKVFIVSFVCSVPDHENSRSLPFGESLRRQTRAAFTVLRATGTVEGSLTEIGFDGDPSVHEAATQMAAAVRMLVNSLLYICMPRADMRDEWPADAPEAWVRGAERPNPGDAAKYRNKLAARGYFKTRICGRSYEASLKALAEGIRQGKTPHWRSGHWRRQHYGTGNRQIRRILIPPTVVNMHLGFPDIGRVYDVMPPAAQPPEKNSPQG